MGFQGNGGGGGTLECFVQKYDSRPDLDSDSFLEGITVHFLSQLVSFVC